MVRLPKPQLRKLLNAIKQHVRPPERRRVLHEVLFEGEPWSFRDNVLRVGDTDPLSGNASWHYRGYHVQRDCGRFACRYTEGTFTAGRHESLPEFKAAVDRRAGRLP